MTGAWGGDAAAPARLLPGIWAIAREISGEGARFAGRGTFAPLADGRLHYREEGLLDLADGTRLDARQAYVFVPEPTGFSVFFDTVPPRLFHTIALSPDADGGFVGQATHPCRADLYASRYRFAPDGDFETVHVVTGPKKDYTMRSLYTRAPREPGRPL